MTLIEWIDHDLGLGDGATKSVGEAIAEGMAPFRIWYVETVVDFDIDMNEYRIIGLARYLSGNGVEVRLTLDRKELLDNPDGVMEEVAERFYQSFRYMNPWPAGPNVHLGEN